jgi:hypothetical protein
MILTLNLPFNKTSFTMFFLICTWITTIWLSIVIIDAVISYTIDCTIYFVINLSTIYGLSGFIFCQIYIFNLGAIFSNHPKFKVWLISNIYLLISWIIYFTDINLLWETTYS